MEKETLDRIIDKVLNDYELVFVALGHYDGGKVIQGCNCPYCEGRRNELRNNSS